MRFSDVIDTNIIKHLPGKHNQKNHAPYKHRTAAWGKENNLPYKPEYKGKGLGEAYNFFRNPYKMPKQSAKLSVQAGTLKVPGKTELMGKTKVELYEMANTLGMVKEKGIAAFKAKSKEATAEAIADHLKTSPQDIKLIKDKLVAGKTAVKDTKAALKEATEATGTKGTAAAKTAAAVVAAKKTPEGEPTKVVDTIPDVSQLKKAPGALGGTGEKHKYVDADGNEYMFKPAQTKSGASEPFRADVQEAASKLSRMIKDNPLDTVEVKTVTIDGKVGTLQRIIPNKGSISGDPKNLTDSQRNDLLREHTVDWLMGNFDAHNGQFIQMRNGRVVGVDKDQSFRYVNDPKSQKMSMDYAPNKVYGAGDPVYNALFRGHLNGDYKLDLQSVQKAIQKVEAIPNAKYREMFRSYAEGLHGKGAKAEKLLDQIVQRKQNLRSDYETFFSQVEGPGFKFRPDAVGYAGYTKAKLLEMGKAAGKKVNAGMTKEQIIAALSTAGSMTAPKAGAAIPIKPGVQVIGGVPHFGTKTPLISDKGDVNVSLIKGDKNNLAIADHSAAWILSGATKTKLPTDLAALYLVSKAKDSGIALTKTEARAGVLSVKAFTGVHSSSIRKAQRGETVSDYDKWKKAGDQCDKIIEAAPKWDSSGTLYRKIDISSTKMADFLSKTKEGAIIDQMGTSSWSNNESTWSGNVKFVLKSTMMATSVKNISEHSGENEVLMHSGARMRVDTITQNSYGGYVIEVTEVPIYTSGELSTVLSKADEVSWGQQQYGGDIMKGNETDVIRVIDPKTGESAVIEMVDGKALAHEGEKETKEEE